MIRRLMEQALGARLVVFGLALVLALAGFYSFTQLDIEAYSIRVAGLSLEKL